MGAVATLESRLLAEIDEPRRFFNLLFDPQDLVLIRVVETWIEGGQRRSRAVPNQSRCHTVARFFPLLFHNARKVAERNHANVFFGVCPRVGPRGYDQSWQIRTVRCLWCDIDLCSPEEALERCRKNGLPEPSIVVSSGNGVHLYWLLSEPYLIDDADNPPQVHNDWTEINGKQRCIKYFNDVQGERINLNDPATGKRLVRSIPKLSPKAQHIQDVLSGLAEAIGGDHTQDLARLMRIPGTFNRKDERNGREPVLAKLIKDDGPRHQFSAFERFAESSPAKKRRESVAATPLPTVRKMSAVRQDKLNDRINVCRLAEPGTRSEADFALCADAIRKGYSAGDVWALVADVGKFQERGEEYFQRTWGNAEDEVRTNLHVKAERCLEHTQQNARSSRQTSEDDRPVIRIDPAQPVAPVMAEITDVLLAADNFFTRAYIPVSIRGEKIRTIDDAKPLAGILNSLAEVAFVQNGGEQETFEYRPLPANYATTWLHHPTELARLPAIKLFTRSPVCDERFELVSPGYDTASGIYYAGPRIEPLDGTEHLDVLLKEFCFHSAADRTNYMSQLVTVPLVYHFIGSKPGALFTGNQPGLGKTMLAQLLGILRDGRVVETVSYNDNDEEFEKRLGSRVRSGVTTLIIDNAKHRRGARTIESACLERCITDPILSFRHVGHSSEIRAENSHFVCITANTPEVGRDLVTRSIPINLYFEGDPTNRRFSMADPESYALEHRAEILGELIGLVERWKQAGRPGSEVRCRFNKRRWAQVVGGVLAVNGEQEFLANFDEAQRSLDPVRTDFEALVEAVIARERPITSASQWAKVAGEHSLLRNDLGDDSAKSRSTRMGFLLSRFVSEQFQTADGRRWLLHRRSSGNNTEYRLEEVP